MRIVLMIFFCVFFLAGCNESVEENKPSGKWSFHTTPDKWEQSRIFHTPFDDYWADRISITKQPFNEITGEKNYSANKAYWFIANQPDTMKAGPYDFTVNIYNERDYIIKLNFLDIYGNFERQAYWINEKIIYSEIWLGRVLGIALIYDVEKELVIYKEMINDGGIPFMQYKQMNTIR